jgi:hypothetical protein
MDGAEDRDSNISFDTTTPEVCSTLSPRLRPCREPGRARGVALRASAEGPRGIQLLALGSVKSVQQNVQQQRHYCPHARPWRVAPH